MSKRKFRARGKKRYSNSKDKTTNKESKNVEIGDKKKKKKGKPPWYKVERMF